MDYEQKYKEALDEAKAIHKAIKQDLKPVIEQIFPELKESDDDRIRKAIICGMNALKKGNRIYFAGIYIDDILAWLEKQGEQKCNNTDFSDLRTWKYIVDAVLTEKEGIGQYLDSPVTEEVAKKLQKRFGNIA